MIYGTRPSRPRTGPRRVQLGCQWSQLHPDVTDPDDYRGLSPGGGHQADCPPPGCWLGLRRAAGLNMTLLTSLNVGPQAAKYFPAFSALSACSISLGRGDRLITVLDFHATRLIRTGHGTLLGSRPDPVRTGPCRGPRDETATAARRPRRYAHQRCRTPWRRGDRRPDRPCPRHTARTRLSADQGSG